MKFDFNDLLRLVNRKQRFRFCEDGSLEMNIEPGQKFCRGDLPRAERKALCDYLFSESTIKSESELPIDAWVTIMHDAVVKDDAGVDLLVLAGTAIPPNERGVLRQILANGGILCVPPL